MEREWIAEEMSEEMGASAVGRAGGSVPGWISMS